MESVELGGREISPTEPVFIIAEAGGNHNGDFDRALDLIDSAAAAGADAVKFQTYRKERLYVDQRTDNGRYSAFEEREMPYDWIPRLAERCSERGVAFLSTPFDEESAQALAGAVPAFKIASLTLSYHELIRSIARFGKPMIVSTGAHTASEVDAAVDVLVKSGIPFVLLHCVSSYPTSLSAANVRVVETLRSRYGVPVGLSDHTEEPLVAPGLAVALGASVLEKHITVDSSLPGPDHEMSLEPTEFKQMVDHVRDCERALGSPAVEIHDSEAEIRKTGRRRLYVAKPVSREGQLTQDHVVALRPGERETGLPAEEYDSVIGRRAKTELKEGDPITSDVLKGGN